MASSGYVAASFSSAGLRDAHDADLATEKFESLSRTGSQNEFGQAFSRDCEMVGGGDDRSPPTPLFGGGAYTNTESPSSFRKISLPAQFEQELVSLKEAIQKGRHDGQATELSAPGHYTEPGAEEVCACGFAIVKIQNGVAVHVTDVSNMYRETSTEVNAKSSEDRDEHLEVADEIGGGNENSPAATVIPGFSAFAIADEEGNHADVNVVPPESVEAIQTSGRLSNGDGRAEIDNAVFSFTGLNHVAFCVEDLERSLDFYCGFLGLKPSIDRPDLPYRGAWLFVGAEGIHLMEVPNPDPVSGRPAHGGFDRHACLNCKNVEGVRLALEQAGIPYQLSMVPSLFTRDPDGNGLELIEVGL